MKVLLVCGFSDRRRGHIIKLILFGLAIQIAFPAFDSAQGAMVSYSKNGNEFSAVSGQYATESDCAAGQTCSWIEGDQIILGVYYANPATWNGGSASWQFDIAEPLNSVQAATLTIQWPALYGKGLHSPNSTGSATVSIRSAENVVAAPAVSTSYRCGNDYFAHPCQQRSFTYSVPLGLLDAETKVIVTVANQTAWDIARLTMSVTSVEETGVDIGDGKLFLDGQEFPVQGVVYAPWLLTTGPEPYQQPFPDEFQDVTVQVTRDGRPRVPDYSGDGIIQAWEVIRCDVAVMKAAGVNTIRTYAAGGWHDRNLDGLQQPGEIDQGDLPDWVYDRLLQYAQGNQMMVILGYWVQDENLESASPVCNWDDLEVAKQAFGRVVQKYKGHPSILAWGIGNEVALEDNHKWFDWGVEINAYLNALYAYVRTLDPEHPILYARFVGEDANFSNLSADIIGVNAYLHSAEALIDRGEFDIPPPAGKAYMLGEFGHILEQAPGHRALAQQYAGGCFLEFNNAWWKGDGQNLLGVVDETRKIMPDRFTALTDLYHGDGLDLCTTDYREDGDVDGLDLHLLAFGLEGSLAELAVFAAEFGQNSCP